MEFLFGYLLSILVGGVLLLELNRLLRPGGYFVWSATPVYQKLPEDVGIWQGTTRNNDWCQLTPVIVEVDRILRPGGHLIVRDNVGVDAVGRLFPSIAKFITQTLPLRPPRHSMRLFLEHPSVDRSATFSVAISTMSKEECPPGVHRWPPPSQSRHVLQEQGSPTGPPPLRRHRRRLHPALSRPFQRPPLPLLLRGCNRPRARHQDLPSYEPQRRQGRLAFDLVKQMSSTEIPLKLRSFGPTLFEFYKKGEVGKAREVSESMAEIIESWIVTEAAEEVGLEKGAVWKVEEGMVKGRWMRLVCAGVAFKAVFPDRSRPREFFPGETRCVEGGGNMNEISVCRCCSRDRLPREVKT
ncbi:hypothetical protein GW17_00033598 [Ensete ventricosum]|nr:hypothetical protein GW17_00033598 [Ensete ventricosum]